MEDFTIISRLTANEYAMAMFVGLYKKPVFILATLLGLYFTATIILNHFNIIKYYSETPYFDFFAVCFFYLQQL